MPALRFKTCRLLQGNVRNVVIFFGLITLYYYMCSHFGFIPDFIYLLERVGLHLGGRALSFLMIKIGCSGGLALAIGFAARALFASEAPADLLHFLNEDGAAASSSSRGEESIVRAPSPGGPVEIFDVPETPPQGTSVNPPIQVGEEAHQTAISRAPMTGESSSAPRVIEVHEVPQDEIWAAVEQGGNVGPNIVRSKCQP